MNTWIISSIITNRASDRYSKHSKREYHEPHKYSWDWQDWGLTLEALPPRGGGSAGCPKKDKRAKKNSSCAVYTTEFKSILSLQKRNTPVLSCNFAQRTLRRGKMRARWGVFQMWGLLQMLTQADRIHWGLLLIDSVLFVSILSSLFPKYRHNPNHSLFRWIFLSVVLCSLSRIKSNMYTSNTQPRRI